LVVFRWCPRSGNHASSSGDARFPPSSAPISWFVAQRDWLGPWKAGNGLFILEALPAILGGTRGLFYLTDFPAPSPLLQKDEIVVLENVSAT